MAVVQHSEGDHAKHELVLSIASGVFLILGVSLEWILGQEEVSDFLYSVAIILGGYHPLKQAIHDIKSRHVEIDSLMLIAALGAVFLDRWGEAGLLLFLFSLGSALEHLALQRATRSISNLSKLQPQVALLKLNDGTREVSIVDLTPGDLIIVRPDARVPVDGIVYKGSGAVDQSAITGESIPIEKFPPGAVIGPDKFASLPAEHQVFAGSINGSQLLEIVVARASDDTTLSKMIALVTQAKKQKSAQEQFADRFQKYYVPSVLVSVTILLGAFLVVDESPGESFYRAMCVLIAASPCALAISTPSAVLAGIARSAKEGVLFKGGKPLELLSEVDAIAFDKTGTLTPGKPILTHVVPLDNVSRGELLSMASAIETYSDHPIAKAICKEGDQLTGHMDLPISKIKAHTGRGLEAHIKDQIIFIGNRRLMLQATGSPIPHEIHKEMEVLEQAGHTVMIMLSDQRYIGLLGVLDVARDSAKSTIDRLRKIGIKSMKMLTGDNENVARSIASAVGLDQYQGDMKPEDKVVSIKEMSDGGCRVAMIGDGVNDAPALATSHVGIAVGAAGAAVALETADIALMSDDLEKVPFAILLSRRVMKTIRQNIFISLGVVVILVPFTITGIAEIGPAVIAHEGSTIVVVLNALRLLRFQTRKKS